MNSGIKMIVLARTKTKIRTLMKGSHMMELEANYGSMERMGQASKKEHFQLQYLNSNMLLLIRVKQLSKDEELSIFLIFDFI
jgi:hypothetical protein